MVQELIIVFAASTSLIENFYVMNAQKTPQILSSSF